MPIQYTEAQIINQITPTVQAMPQFYKKGFVNYSGTTEDTDKHYTEVVAKYLLKNLYLLKDITAIKRASSYKMISHNGNTPRAQSNRTEERIAMDMYKQKGLPTLGLVVDYQTPLKNVQKDTAGKIDLIAYDGKVLRLLELKTPDSQETMLRCVLEGYTYLKTVDVQKLLLDFELPLNTIVQASPLVAIYGRQHQEMIERRPQLKNLMQELDSEPFYYYKIEDHYIVIGDKPKSKILKVKKTADHPAKLTADEEITNSIR